VLREKKKKKTEKKKKEMRESRVPVTFKFLKTLITSPVLLQITQITFAPFVCRGISTVLHARRDGKAMHGDGTAH